MREFSDRKISSNELYQLLANVFLLTLKKNMYKINVKDWTKIPLQTLQFILSQAERKLEYSIQNSDKITNRFYSILVVLVGLFTASIGYFSSQYSEKFVYDCKYFINLSFLVILLIEILLFIKNINPRNFMGLGRSPKELSNIDLLQPNDALSEQQQYKALLIGEINNLESKIEYNTNQNRSRLTTLKYLIYSIVFLVSIYFILFQVFLH